MPPREIAEKARREEEAEERLHPAAQEDGAVARESEALLGGHPVAQLDLPAHLHHDTLDDDDLAAALNLSEWEATPHTPSRPSPLEPGPGEDADMEGLPGPGEDADMEGLPGPGEDADMEGLPGPGEDADMEGPPGPGEDADMEGLPGPGEDADMEGPPGRPLPDPSACSRPGRPSARHRVALRRSHAPAVRQGGRPQRRPPHVRGGLDEKGRVKSRCRVSAARYKKLDRGCSPGTPFREDPGLVPDLIGELVRRAAADAALDPDARRFRGRRRPGLAAEPAIAGR